MRAAVIPFPGATALVYCGKLSEQAGESANWRTRTSLQNGPGHEVTGRG